MSLQILINTLNRFAFFRNVGKEDLSELKVYI